MAIRNYVNRDPFSKHPIKEEKVISQTLQRHLEKKKKSVTTMIISQSGNQNFLLSTLHTL